MKNILSYYYNVHPDNISHKQDDYYFNYNNNYYVFQMLKRPSSDVEFLYELNKKMIEKNILVHEIILNTENNKITYINNKPFVLMIFHINPNLKISLYDIYYINNQTINLKTGDILNRFNWINLWETKNDYIESQINELGIKFPNISKYINYYIGLAENAISYARNVLTKNEKIDLCVSHKRIKFDDSLFDLYNPLNYICDYKIRDICEYVKDVFFYKNEKIAYYIVENYFKSNKITYTEALLFYSRLLYPSYFFDLYDDIINEKKNELEIEKIIIKSNEYEYFLLNTYLFLSNLYNIYIPSIDWIIKRSYI